MSIKLTEAEKIKVLNSDDLYAIMQKVLLRESKIDQDREHFWVIGLSTSNRLLFIELVSKGTINKTLVDPMEVFSLALQKRAVKIMLVHNHPSGELKPSEKDINITDRLIQVGLIVDTVVLDHLIISDKSYLSFADNGLLEQLKESKKWVPRYKEEQLIRSDATKIADRKKTISFVKNCLKQGLTFEVIEKLTGLPIEEIKKIRVPKK
jgi:DNA repair protein RadC|tara:strand:- start:1284 stop:1907 length:624 start_codon:yes stop_codon:yes gene_type:complete